MGQKGNGEWNCVTLWEKDIHKLLRGQSLPLRTAACEGTGVDRGRELLKCTWIERQRQASIYLFASFLFPKLNWFAYLVFLDVWLGYTWLC